MRIGFVHPDLGIGGAERLVVDAALGLQQKGHHYIWTSHHDPSHCFQETKDDTLNVRVYGDFIPRHIKGKFHLSFFWVLNIHLYYASSLCSFTLIMYDVIFCDQISVTNPLLKIRGAKVLFYCHFPDKLLSKRTTFWKQLYRVPIDLLEELTTGCADVVVVNSQFTASKYATAFTLLRAKPRVLYPCINMSNYDRAPKGPVSLGDVPEGKKLILSINRFERKKNVALVIRAFALVKSKVKATLWEELHLVLAGGYDPRVAENVEHVAELKEIVKKSKLQGKVSFIQSFSEEQRYVLLKRAIALVYTPSDEHFGIGPLEGMYASRPVVAVNSGGPLETIQDNVTGFLRSPEPESFATALEEIAKDTKKAVQMGEAGRAWVQDKFSLRVFRDQLDEIVQQMVRKSE